MFRYRIILFCILINLSASAQYLPNSSQAFQFASLYNPAFVGVESFGDLKVGYRSQMTGLGPYAPKFINITGNFRLKQPLDLTTHSLRIGSSKAAGADFIPKSKRIIHGLGLNLFNENVGLFDRLGGGVSYSFNYPLSNKMRLAFGVTAMVENRKLDANEIYLGENPDADELVADLLANGSNQMEMNARGGLLLYTNRFYIGVSSLSLFSSAIKSSSLEDAEPTYRGVVQTGISLPVSEGLLLQPSIVAVMQVDNEFLIDYSLKAQIKQKIWTGVTYRDIEAAVIALGFNFNSLVGVSYSYEMSTGEFKQFNDGSHELVLSLRLNNFKRMAPYTW